MLPFQKSSLTQQLQEATHTEAFISLGRSYFLLTNQQHQLQVLHASSSFFQSSYFHFAVCCNNNNNHSLPPPPPPCKPEAAAAASDLDSIEPTCDLGPPDRRHLWRRCLPHRRHTPHCAALNRHEDVDHTPPGPACRCSQLPRGMVSCLWTWSRLRSGLSWQPYSCLSRWCVSQHLHSQTSFLFVLSLFFFAFAINTVYVPPGHKQQPHTLCFVLFCFFFPNDNGPWSLGKTWKSYKQRYYFRDLVYGNGVYVGLANDYVSISRDGAIWHPALVCPPPHTLCT